MAKHSRRRKIVIPRLQTRIVLIFLSISCVSVLVQLLVLNQVLTNVAERLPYDGDILRAELPTILSGSLLVAFAVLVPLTLAIGIMVTFRIAGPIYRFEMFLRDVIAGKNTGPCRLRERDELTGLCDLINEALARDSVVTNPQSGSDEDQETSEPLREAS